MSRAAYTLHGFPPDVSPGQRVASLEVVVPAGLAGLPLFAALRHHGRIVARGAAVAADGAPVEIPLVAVPPATSVPDDVYELWLTLDRDGWQSCYPGYGDLFIRVPWELNAESRVKRLVDPAAWRERRLSAPDNLVTVHYHRYDEAYDNVGIWTWDHYHQRSPVPNEIWEIGRDEFGLVFQLDRADYGARGDSDRIGLLPRLAGDWNRKDGENRYWKPELGREIYLLGTRAQIWSERPDVRPHVVAAFVDAPHRVVVQLSKLVTADEILASSVRLFDERGHAFQPVQAQLVGADVRGKTNFIEVIFFEPLNVAHQSYSVSVEKFTGTAPAVPRGVLDDADLFGDLHTPLGAHYTPDQTKFGVFAPSAEQVNVILYAGASGGEGRRVQALTRGAKGIWSGAVAGDLAGKFYLWQLSGPDLSADRETVDIYATNAVNNHQRARITDLAQTNPPGWDETPGGPPLGSPVDMVVYEMHVRDFTIAANSGARWRGEYRGFAEKVDHLVELGVTHVQLMPVQDFEVDEFQPSYNWGYMPVAFNSPEGWFASNPLDDSRIRELKQLIHALHERGIGVILDVVYNHTGSSATFQHHAPRYYYRLNPDGSYSNGSGCGNEFRTESPMGRRFMMESLKFWVTEYRVDGFRFDLMALLDLETMQEAERELRALNPDIVLYGEPWMAAGSAMKGLPTDKGTIRGTGIGAFNDGFRNALKGSPEGGEPGFIQNGWHRDAVIRGLEGSCHDWAPTPAQTINYLTCHDNLTLWDKLVASRPDADPAAIRAMMKLGHLLLYTAQGVPFLHGGEEFGRHKKGHHNSYNAPDDINQVDWSLKQINHDLFTYTRDLIALRKAHPAFRLRTKKEIEARVRFPETGSPAAIVYQIDARDVPGETWEQICVIANAADADQLTVKLPAGPWRVALDQAGIVADTVTVPAKSGLILYQVGKPT